MDEDIGSLFKKLQMPADVPVGLTAKTQIVNTVQPVEMGDCSRSENGRAPEGIENGQLQHQIRTAEEGGPGTEMLIHTGGFAALSEISAHDNNNIIQMMFLPKNLQLVLMSVVERVVFGDDGTDLHKNLPYVLNSLYMYYRHIQENKKSYF